MSPNLPTQPGNRFEYIYQVIEFVDDRVGDLSIVGLFIMFNLITINSLSRYLFDNPLLGIISPIELYLMPMVIATYLSKTHQNDGNISLNIFSRSFKDKSNRVISSVSDVLMLLVVLILSYLFLIRAVDRTLVRATTAAGYPTYVSYWIVMVGLAFFSYRLIVKMVKRIYA